MFDSLAWRRDFYDRYLLGLDDDEEEELDEEEEEEEDDFWEDHEDEADTPMGSLARIADDVEAGRVELPPRWKLDRPSPGVQVWTTPSGRRYACDPTGAKLPLPDGEAPFHAWAS
jgi:hypothetical protein